MKQVIAVVVIVIAILTVIFLAAVSMETDSGDKTPPSAEAPTTLEGSVTAISPATLTLTSGKTQYDLTLSEATVVIDSNNQSFSTDQIQKSFVIRAESISKKNDQLIPERIIILNQPNVIVFSPEPRTIVGLRFIVTGVARVFENTVSIKITRESPETILMTFTTANAPDVGKYGSFSHEIDLRGARGLRNGEKITLIVFQQSAKDGSEIDVAAIPLTIELRKDLLVKAFFANESLNSTNQCGSVFPVSREIPYTQAVARGALEELLKGPSDEEIVKGYDTAINASVRIQRLVLTNGVATVDFSPELQKGVAGSCRTAAIRSQITQTLKQFPSVQEVRISVDGDAETSLQP